MNRSTSFWELLEDSLRVDYQSGAVTSLSGPHTTGWRSLPAIVTAHVPRGRFLIRLENNRSIPIQAGQCVCLSPGTRHCITKTSGKAESRWSHINFYILGARNIADLLTLPLIRSGASAKRIGTLNETLAELHQQPPSFLNTLERKSVGLHLLRELINGCVRKDLDLEHLQRAQRMTPAFEFMHKNLGAPITQEQLARHLHLSTSRFRAVFKAAVGMSPLHYLLNLRLQQAQRLLIRTNLSVQEVAAQSGFEDPFHFSRFFKKKCGTSPSSFRKQMQENQW